MMTAWNDRQSSPVTGLEELRGWLEDVQFSAESDDGLIAVSVTASGVLADVRLGSRVFQTPTDPEGTAATIVELSDRARAEAEERVEQATRAVVGTGFTLQDITNPAAASRLLMDVGRQVRTRLAEESEHG